MPAKKSPSASTSTDDGTSAATIKPVPYVALGDSLTQGMQSLGIARLSQRYSYPQQIADFLGITPFAQPLLNGASAEDQWVGNPPNIELMLRRAERYLHDNLQPKGQNPPHPTAWQELYDQAEDIGEVLRVALTDYIHTVEDNADPSALLVAPPPASGLYQNLGVWGFTVHDVLATTYNYLHTQLHPTFRGSLAKIARHALEGGSDALIAVETNVFGNTRAHPSLLESLTSMLLTKAQGDFGQRLGIEKVGYVLGQGDMTALKAARAQQPHIITLWIGANDLLGNMLSAHIWENNKPLYTKQRIFEEEIAALVEQLLAFDSQPHIFLATLPSLTASPCLERNRLGHWKSLFPSAAFLVDAQLLEIEIVVHDYNSILENLAKAHEGRVWLVDIHALQERMQRGTRNDAQLMRRVVQHAVRSGALSKDAGKAVLRAAQAGNIPTIEAAIEVDKRLNDRSRTAVQKMTPEESGERLGDDPYTTSPQAPNIDAFTVQLASGQVYRITGEFLGVDDDGIICQGGSVGLDSFHLTNTGYAYVAREFLKKIHEADQDQKGAILKGLRWQEASDKEFEAALDEALLRVASEDPLLNNPPKLIAASLDMAGAVSDLLGELHYSDPYLSR